MYTDQHYDGVRPSVISVTGGGGGGVSNFQKNCYVTLEWPLFMKVFSVIQNDILQSSGIPFFCSMNCVLLTPPKHLGMTHTDRA